MSQAVLLQAIGRHVQAIRLCIDNRLFMPALVLIFSGIDFVSALARPATKPEAQRSDFIGWVDRYMPCGRLGLTATDLYGARCGVVHAMTSESRMQREGKVKRVFYTWGIAKPEHVNAKLHGDPAIFIKVETLFDAFLEGLAAFGDAIEKNEALQRLVISRTGQMFAEYPDLAQASATDDKHHPSADK